MKIFISMGGFQLGKQFVVKELTILSNDTEWKHFIFVPPLQSLSESDKRTIRYTTKKIHHLNWTEGDVPYSASTPIIRKFERCTIYTYGYTCTNYLRSLLPTTVIIDIQKEQSYTMPNIIPMKGCFYNHGARHCSLAKASIIRAFMQDLQRFGIEELSSDDEDENDMEEPEDKVIQTCE